MSKFFKSFVITLITAFVLTACGGSSRDSGPGATPAGTFTKTVVAAGTADYFQSLFSSSFVENRFMMLYLAEDIKGSGIINSISFKYDAAVASAVSCPNVTIKMGHTDVNSASPLMSTTYADNIEQGQGSFQTVVDNATITIPAGAAGEYFSIALVQPFNYNGVDNLILQISRSAACTSNVPVTTHAATYNCLVYGTGAGASTAVTGGYFDASADVEFVFAGGDNKVSNADMTGDNALTTAPGGTGRTQMLILASDINGSGLITGLAINPDTITAAANVTGMTVKIAHLPVSTTELASATFATNYGGVTPVIVTQNLAYNIPANQPSTVWIPFNNSSFTYDGTSNLLIDITCTVSGSYVVNYKNIPTYRVITSNDPLSATGIRRQRAFEPVFRFYGGQIIVLPEVASIGNSAQVLGSGSAGQMQSLYKSSLLGTSGTITNVYVRLYDAAPAAASLTNYKLYMGHTTKTTYNTLETYASNMDENVTVFSGTLTIQAGLLTGDWVKIPLSSPFAYNSTKNLSILFTTDAGPAGNKVSCRFDAGIFSNNSVGRADNSVTTSGTPSWGYDGIADLALDIVK